MTDSRAIQFRATETGFEPLGVHAYAAFKEQYEAGKRYVLTQHRERSSRSHRHFFACIKEGFDNLPERWAALFKTPEALRKYLLIRAGWADVHTFTCETEAEAKKLRQWLKPIDEFSLVTSEGCVVTRYTAKSMDEENMDGEEFQQMKDRALDELAMMLGVTKVELAKIAGHSS